LAAERLTKRSRPGRFVRPGWCPDAIIVRRHFFVVHGFSGLNCGLEIDNVVKTGTTYLTLYIFSNLKQGYGFAMRLIFEKSML
jgi:hypothetical protein